MIVFAESSDTEIKGSARSIPGLHIRDALDAVAKHHPQLLSKFGGHAMAAGMSLHKQHYEAFCRAFDCEVRRQLQLSDLQAQIFTDGQLEQENLSLLVAEELREAGPWGQHFPEPCFDGVFYCVQQRIVGKNHLKLVLSLDSAGQQVIDAIAFNIDLEVWPNQAEKVRVAYRLDINAFRGRRSLQLMVEYLEPVI